MLITSLGSLGPQLTARELEAVRFWWVELRRCFGAFSASLVEPMFENMLLALRDNSTKEVVLE